MKSTPEKIDVGVIGVGRMGTNHVRVLDELSSCRLLGVADIDHNRAETIAEKFRTRSLPSRELIAQADAVVVAVPTNLHERLVSECLAAGTHALVEKPFVTDPAVGRRLSERAGELDLVLQIGHIERFNPSVRFFLDLIDPSEVVAIHANRLGPPANRSDHIDVILDLMIHDIDVVLTLLGEVPRTISAERRPDGQYATALCGFSNDVVVSFTASRLTQRRVRSLELTAKDRHISLDYLEQSVYIHRHSRPEYLQTDADIRYRHESVIEQPLIDAAEPLKEELKSFISAVIAGTEPDVTPEDGIRAVEVANTIRNLGRNERIEVLSG